MKAVYLKNFRKGFATNSSSTHSVIYKNKGDLLNDLNIFELDYYDRYDDTIAATREAKIKYIAANIEYNDELFDIMSKLYPEMKQYETAIKEQRDIEKMNYEDLLKNNIDYNRFGMAARGRLYFNGSENLEPTIKYLTNVIDNEDIVIVGGSDEEDFVFETIEDHKEVLDPSDVSGTIVKNGNYYIGYGWRGRIRFSLTNEDTIPSYPELIDLKITNKCNNNCPFCYMDSTMKGKEADIKTLKKRIGELSGGYDAWNKRLIEFSVGGGNVLLYPHLEELFEYMVNQGHIVNTTINAKDVDLLKKDEKLKNIFAKYVSGLGVSVTSVNDLPYLEKLRDLFPTHKMDKEPGLVTSNVVIHLIPEMLGVDATKEIMTRLRYMGYYSCLFLGYKTNGRGATQKYFNFTDKDLTELFVYGGHCIGIDTTFANRHKKWLDENFETEATVTLHEGEYSMYIDGVTDTAYKSSYQLDKPYPLKDYSVLTAFKNIREDNGLNTLEEPIY